MDSARFEHWNSRFDRWGLTSLPVILNWIYLYSFTLLWRLFQYTENKRKRELFFKLEKCNIIKKKYIYNNFLQIVPWFRRTFLSLRKPQKTFYFRGSKKAYRKTKFPLLSLIFGKNFWGVLSPHSSVSQNGT